MASFDFESGLGGAQSGAAVGGPYGAIAGFVIGGFLGGRKKARQKRKLREYQRKVRKLASPQHYKETVQKLLPGFRELVAGGAGAATVGGIQDAIARKGLSNTGIGTAISGGAAGIPEGLAFQGASRRAPGVIQNEIAALGGQAPSAPTGIGNELGQIGDIVSAYKQLGATGSKDSGLDLISSGSGAVAPWEIGNRDASTEFGKQFSDDYLKTFKLGG